MASASIWGWTQRSEKGIGSADEGASGGVIGAVPHRLGVVAGAAQAKGLPAVAAGLQVDAPAAVGPDRQGFYPYRVATAT